MNPKTTINRAIHYLVKFLVTYPCIILVSAVIFYSFAAPGNHGLKTIPIEVLKWVDSQSLRTNKLPGYITVDRCVDPLEPNNSQLPQAIAPCKHWTNEEISISQAANQIVALTFGMYFAAVIAALVVALLVNLLSGSIKTMLMPMIELFSETYNALVKAIRSNSKH
ncbi:hypothetical protein [Pseudomonas oryzihabitans]|uniref:hypothetical protein n=1 Tax=Pseudomonas oryzihabitans TaxID=47885 RepID=UPI001269C6E6|nr:hypothetical protein [Pseudomonas oryzihabitans]